MRGLLVLFFWIAVGYFVGAKWPGVAQKVGVA
jgi:hypothetical protein